MLLKSPLLAGTFAEWTGQLGVLGERGGFIDKAVFQNLGLAKDDGIGDIDFEDFVAEGSNAIYVPNASLDQMLETLRSRVHLHVEDVAYQCERTGAGWVLNGCVYDALVLADESPAFAADVIEQANNSAEVEMKQFEEVLRGLVGQLRGLQLSQRFVLQATFEDDIMVMLETCPLAGAIVPHSNVLQFIHRQKRECGTDWWTFHSSADYVQRMAGASEAAITDDLLAHGTAALAQYVTTPLSAPVSSSFSWGTPGTVDKPLGLNEECISIEPWSLVACGDFIGNHHGMEPAALSGMMAADRVVGWVTEAQE
jgi:hypothetical protein